MVLNMKNAPNVEPIMLNNIAIKDVWTFEVLRVTLDTHLTFSTGKGNVLSSRRSKYKERTNLIRCGVDKSILFYAQKPHMLVLV